MSLVEIIFLLRSGIIGIVDLDFLPIRNFADEYPLSSGVALYANNALVGSSCFFRMSFTVPTARSTLLLDWGYLILLWYLNPNALQIGRTLCSGIEVI